MRFVIAVFLFCAYSSHANQIVSVGSHREVRVTNSPSVGSEALRREILASQAELEQFTSLLVDLDLSRQSGATELTRQLTGIQHAMLELDATKSKTERETKHKALEEAIQQAIASSPKVEKFIAQYLPERVAQSRSRMTAAKTIEELKAAFKEADLTSKFENVAKEVGSIDDRLAVLKAVLKGSMMDEYLSARLDSLASEPKFCEGVTACGSGSKSKTNTLRGGFEKPKH